MSQHQGIEAQLISIAMSELKLTMGCTDPVAIAFSCNKAMELYISQMSIEKEIAIENLESIEIFLDRNLFKNATSARIPGSRGKGIILASTLGIILPSPKIPLLIFKGITEREVQKAHSLLKNTPIKVAVKEDKNHIYASTSLIFKDNIHSKAIVEGQHDIIQSLSFQGCEIQIPREIEAEEKDNSPIPFQLEDVLSCLETIPLKEIDFINEGFSYNVASGDYIHQDEHSEASILHEIYDEDLFLKASLIHKTRIAISYATKRRMGGEEIPIISCGGSGNHGITFFISLFYGFNLITHKKEILHTALLGLYLLHMVKQETGLLTPMCGCALSSALAVAASLTWASGGEIDDMVRAMNYVVNTLAGISCDGAKPSCSLKTSLAGQVALESALFALSSAPLDLDEGLSGDSFPLLLSIIKKIHLKGMAQFDSTMVEIIQQRDR